MTINRDKLLIEVADDTSVDFETIKKIFDSFDIIAKNYLGKANENTDIQLEVLEGCYFMSKYVPVYTGTEYRFEPCIRLYSAVDRWTNNDITKIARMNNLQT